MRPKVSVVTVNYNDCEELEKTIRSVIAQTYDNIEYIIIDGASTDNSVNVIKNYQGNIVKWLSEKDHGIYDAMNKSIEFVSGDWVIFMNSGDTFYSKDVVDSVFVGCENRSCLVIYGDVCLRFLQGDVIRQVGLGDGAMPPLCHQATFINTEIFKKRKFNLQYILAADHELFYKLYVQGEKFLYINKIIANYDMCGVSAQRLDLYYKEVSMIEGNYSNIMMFKSILKTIVRRIFPYFFDLILYKVLNNRYRR